MTSLKLCRDCGNSISRSAVSCPHCGASVAHTLTFASIGAVGGAVFLIAFTIGFATSVSKDASIGARQTSKPSANTVHVASKERFQTNTTLEVDRLMLRAERAVRSGDLPGLLVTLNRLIQEYPTAMEAKLVINAVRASRRQGLRHAYTGKISSCQFADAQSITGMYKSLAEIAVAYPKLTVEQQDGLSTIYGKSTFATSRISIQTLLRAILRLDDARRTAVEKP